MSINTNAWLACDTPQFLGISREREKFKSSKFMYLTFSRNVTKSNEFHFLHPFWSAVQQHQSFLSRIITGDEKWYLFVNLKHKKLGCILKSNRNDVWNLNVINSKFYAFGGTKLVLFIKKRCQEIKQSVLNFIVKRINNAIKEKRSKKKEIFFKTMSSCRVGGKVGNWRAWLKSSLQSPVLAWFFHFKRSSLPVLGQQNYNFE